MINEPLACFFEQVTPEVREKFKLPGETIINSVAVLSTLDIGEHQKELDRVLKVLERLDQLPNEGFIKLVGIFEQHLMHDFIDNGDAE